MTRAWQRRTVVAALAASLAVTPAARAQLPPFPIPIGAEVLVVPLLLLLIPLGMKLAQTDEKTVRELERRGDWDGVVALADKRLAQGADEPTWREIRGRALQRSGRCALAMPDLRAAFERRMAAGAAADAVFPVGLALGLCELQAWQLEAAAGTMSRLATLAPGRWEPPYHLAIIAAQRGDAVAVEAALARVAAIDAGRAADLRRELAARSLARRDATPANPAPAATPWPAAPAAHAAVQLVASHLRIGDRALALPAGDWRLLSTATHAVGGSTFRRAHFVDEVALVTARALAVGADGAFAAALAFTANPQRSYGTRHWAGEDFCAVRDAIHVDRFHSAFDQPECLFVRVLDAAAAGASARLGPALAAAAQAGVALPAPAYEIHYSLYGQDWMIAVTWLLPLSSQAGHLAAVQWARDLAAQVAPLARRPAALPALVPPLGP